MGSTKPIQVDVRIIAATNRNLVELVKEGRFPGRSLLPAQRRPDCASGFLRERKEDIPALVHYFLQRSSRETKKTSPT